jgi:hypothetical protein
MRYLIGSQMGLFVVPVLLIVGAAYVWVMERVLGGTVQVDKAAETRRERKAA